MPYLHPFGTGTSKIGNDSRTTDTKLLSDEKLKAEFERIKPLCSLHSKLYNKEMVRHEFLGSYKVQKATYSDGTTVTVDLNNNTYKVN